MSVHTLSPAGRRREPIEAMARAAREDPVIRPDRSCCSLGEGKAVCILEGHEKESIETWQ
jgi:hypothetical protein